MEIRQYTESDSAAIEALFRSVFSQAGGEAEGELVGNVAKELMRETAEDDLHGFVAVEQEQIVGSIFFSRVTFEGNAVIECFLLAPVAIHSGFQRQGLGQKLINEGLNRLRDQQVNVVLTYGDPKYYCKVGFQSISHKVIRAPFTLSQPEGWLGQSLLDGSIETLSGRCLCVNAWNNPHYW